MELSPEAINRLSCTMHELGISVALLNKSVLDITSILPMNSVQIQANSAKIAALEAKLEAIEEKTRERVESGRWVVGTLIAATILLLSLVLFGLQHFK